jgi:ribosome-binding factor A
MASKRSSGRRFVPGQNPPTGNKRKTLQLCGQVARTVEGVLVGELGDDYLSDLVVHAVEPAPDESRLMVTVGPYAPDVHLNPAEVLARIGAASAHIRSEVAAAITRKRTPTLVYRYAEPRVEGNGPVQAGPEPL